MSIKTRAQLKGYLETNDVPIQGQYADLVDSVPNFADDNYVVGFQLKGAWSNSTAYILNDLVLYNGSSYACILYHTNQLPTNTNYWKQITTVGEKGDAATIAVGTVSTLPAGSPATVVNSGTSIAAIFDIAIPQGADGTDATGDVNGPATNSDSYIPQWDGANSKTLKNGIPTSTFAPALGVDENYVSDAQLVVIGNTSGINTGDNATNSQYSGLAASKADLASPTFTGLVTTPAIKITTGASLGKVLTSDADGDATWETPSAGGSSLWTLMPGTPVRVGNTSFTVTGDITSYIAKGMIIKWTESSVVRCAMVSIPSTYGAPNTTITIVGDTMASIDASSLKYCMLGAEMFTKIFAYAGTIGAIATGIANTITAMEPMRLLGADLWVGTAGTTNSTTIDININGTTAFNKKPTLATTVQSSPLPFTADTNKSLALGDDLTLDIDAIQTTAAIDLYVMVYLFPTRYLSLT